MSKLDQILAPMKLSEAMRKGCEIAPKQSSEYLEYDESGLCGACALGAAFLGVYGREFWSKEKLFLAFPFLENDHDLRLAIQRMNGWFELDWSREEIADWLEEQGL